MTTLQHHNAMVVSRQQRRTTQPYVFCRFHFLTTQSAGGIPDPPTKRCQCQRARPQWKRARSASSIKKRDVLACSSGRGAYPFFSHLCWMRYERRMRALRVAASSVLSGWVTAAPSVARWSTSSLPGRPQWPEDYTIRIDFDMTSTVAAACSWMTDKSAELALLIDWTIDLQLQIMAAETDNEMEDSNWMASLMAAFSAWNELLWEPERACHSWMRSWLRTTEPALLSLISSRTEPSV